MSEQKFISKKIVRQIFSKLQKRFSHNQAKSSRCSKKLRFLMKTIKTDLELEISLMK